MPNQSDSSPYTSRHKNHHSQWPVWDPPVSQSSFPRFYPLVGPNHGDHQRNVQSYNDSPQLGDYHADDWNVDSFDSLNANANVYDPALMRALEDAEQYMEEDSVAPVDVTSLGEDSEEACGPDITFSFAESFFSNPFAVSFPGDLPCPLAPVQASDISSGSTSPSFSLSSKEGAAKTSPPITAAVPTPHSFTTPDFVRFPSTTSPKSIASTSATLNGGISKPAKAVTSAPTTKYGPQIHFVDMADKKGAQRIRNTMNSRKHRQNKLDKIRELEKKLAVLESEKQSWSQQQALTPMGPGGDIY